MPIPRLLLPILLLAVTLPAGAQGRPADTTRAARIEGLAAILLGEAALETERGGDAAAAARNARAAAAVAEGYRLLAADPQLTQEVIARVVANYFTTRSAGAPAADVSARVDEQVLRLLLLQAAQNARIVEQNDRMIELLRTIAGNRR